MHDNTNTNTNTNTNMALKTFGSRGGDAEGIIRDTERTGISSAMEGCNRAITALNTLKQAATQSGSKSRPGLYQKAEALLNQAKEYIDRARSSNGR